MDECEKLEFEFWGKPLMSSTIIGQVPFKLLQISTYLPFKLPFFAIFTKERRPPEPLPRKKLSEQEKNQEQIRKEKLDRRKSDGISLQTVLEDCFHEG